MAVWRTLRVLTILALIGFIAGPVHAEFMPNGDGPNGTNGVTWPSGEDHYVVVVNNGGANYECGDTGTFQLPKFDDQGGTKILQAVIISIEGWALEGFNAADNESPSFTGWGTVQIGAAIDVTSMTTTVPVVLLTAPTDSNSGFMDLDDPCEPSTGSGLVHRGRELNADLTGPDCVSAGGDPNYDGDSVAMDKDPNDIANALLNQGDLIVMDPMDPRYGTRIPVTDFLAPGTITWQFDSKLLTSGSWTVNPTQAQTDPPDFYFIADVRYPWVMPEPTTVAMLALGGAALLLRRRSRRL